jgi:hypothetical protein
LLTYDDGDFTFFGEFNRVADNVKQDLTDTGRVTAVLVGQIDIDIRNQFEFSFPPVSPAIW